MALRIRRDGRILCAALSIPQEGDVYLDDETHYHLSVEKKVLVTSDNEHHMNNGGQWWWKGREPIDVIIDKFYYEND